MIITEFGDAIAARMRDEHQALAARWFARLLDLLPVDAREVFPTESLLDHIPSLILELSNYLRNPEESAIAANTSIVAKAQELGALRHQQQASLHQVLREYQLLSGVLVAFVVEEMHHLKVMPTAPESVAVVSRLHEAVNVLSQATVNEFVTRYTQTIAEQNQRLEQFTRMAAHEWRQPLGTLQFGVSLLQQGALDPPRTERTLANLERNVQRLVELTRKLETLARIQDDEDNPIVQEVSASTVAEQAARQLREMAEARDVTIGVADDLPSLTVDVGRLELVFVNLMSNAVKYSDPAKPARYVKVTGSIDEDGWCHLDIADNGIGIPPTSQQSIFQRFTRAHDGLSHIDGVGLGLAIADDCVRAIGGRINVRSAVGEGTTFTLSLPQARRMSIGD